MLARARVKLKNAESSISFIQEQHTRTLEGLHLEIQQLQQKNARLTFELALQNSSSSKTGSSEGYKHEEEIKAYKTEVNTLQTTITTCKEEIKLLKHKLMSVEANLTEEVTERDAQIGRLGVEVERRARIIVHLTKQLHQMRSEYAQLTEKVLHMQKTLSPETSILQRAVEPPATAVGRIRRRSRRATSSALPQDSHQDTHHEKAVQRRSLPTPPHHLSSSPAVFPRPPSTSPPPYLRERVHRLTQRAGLIVATSPGSSPPSQRSSTVNLGPVHRQKPSPDFLKNTSTSSTPNLAQPEGPILPPIPPNPSLLACRTGPKSSSGDKREKRRLLVKEELTHGKSQAWQELHQSGSD